MTTRRKWWAMCLNTETGNTCGVKHRTLRTADAHCRRLYRTTHAYHVPTSP